MIKKLYDFRQIVLPEALLQAEVTKEEMASELHQTAAKFTAIVAVGGPVQNGDVVALEFVDDRMQEGVRRIYANVGKQFDDVEAQLYGLCVEDTAEISYAGKTRTARIVAIKRLCVPVLTDEHVQKLGLEQVKTLAQLEDYLFEKLAEGQRRRKFRGIMGIVSKTIMENTEFAALEESHPWYQALHAHMMSRVESLAAQEGKTVEQTLPMALRMQDKSLEECRQALKAMCVERARQGALGQAYAKENGIAFSEEGDTAGRIGQYVDYLNQVVYQHFAPQIQVQRQ